MVQNIPLVRISYGFLLADVTAEVLHARYSHGEKVGTYDELVSIAKQYEKWWRPYNDEILKGLCKILNLEFRQNIIDIYVSPWFTPISDPMVVGPAFSSQDSLVNTITHEMIHRLITDNTSTDHDHDFVADWRKLFGENHNWNTLVHIPVHAVMKKLYLDIINRPDLLELDIKDVRNNKPYADAWAYVNKHDYNEIITSLSISRSA